MKSRRALLYMPGDDWKKIVKSITLGVDSICMDMEDGVAVNKKAEARATIARALRVLDFGKSEKLEGAVTCAITFKGTGPLWAVEPAAA